MKKLYWVLFLLPVVCNASPTKKLEQEIIALQQKFDDIDKKMNTLIEKTNAQDVLFAQQACDAQDAITKTYNNDELQTIVEESESIETTKQTIKNTPPKKLKLSWGRRLAPKDKIEKKETKQIITTKPAMHEKISSLLTKEQIVDALDSQGDN